MLIRFTRMIALTATENRDHSERRMFRNIISDTLGGLAVDLADGDTQCADLKAHADREAELVF